MKIAVPRETQPGETRVALTPDVVKRLLRDGHSVQIQRGAGTQAGFLDEAYEAAGATLADDAAVLRWDFELVRLGSAIN